MAATDDASNTDEVHVVPVRNEIVRLNPGLRPMPCGARDDILIGTFFQLILRASRAACAKLGAAYLVRRTRHAPAGTSSAQPVVDRDRMLQGRLHELLPPPKPGFAEMGAPPIG